MSRPLLIPLYLLLGACSHPDPFADWPDVSALRGALPPAPVIKADFPEGLDAAKILLYDFLRGGNGEEEDSYWLDMDDDTGEMWLLAGITADDMPSYVAEEADGFLAWHRQGTWGSVTMDQEVPDFLLGLPEDLTMLLKIYGDVPGMREAWYHLAQVMWNEGFHPLQELACLMTWQTLAADQAWWSRNLPALRERFPLDPVVGKARLVRAFLEWHDYWLTAPQERLAAHFPDGIPTQEEAELISRLEQWLRSPAPPLGQPLLRSEELAFLRGTAFAEDFPNIWQLYGDSPWLPWMTDS